MSRHHLTRAGGDKPALTPLPVDPIKAAHAKQCRANAKAAAAARDRVITAAIAKARELMLALIGDQQLSMHDITARSGYSRAQARYILRSLRIDGLATFGGSNRKGRWRRVARQGVA